MNISNSPIILNKIKKPYSKSLDNILIELFHHFNLYNYYKLQIQLYNRKLPKIY